MVSRMDMFDLSGRVGLVPGSSRAIGVALAKGLLQAGAISYKRRRVSSLRCGSAACLRLNGREDHWGLLNHNVKVGNGPYESP
jgi:NAD(P)-dependent dehydrogenase (short-subunit alcohol dehydrogenase family)